MSQYLHECFTYRDGQLIWKARPRHHFATASAQKRFNTMYAGHLVGTIDPIIGYLRTRFGGKTYLVHRLVFELHYGYCPEKLDHINGRKLDNRIENLRAVTVCQNNQNSVLHGSNTSGVRGLSPHSGGWQVNVSKDRKKVVCLWFKCRELAELVAIEAVSLWHGDYARGAKNFTV